MPHHHHEDVAEAGLMERHDGKDEHPDHHHHTIDPFFSLLNYFNDVEQFEFVAAALPFVWLLDCTFAELGLTDEENIGGTDPPPIALLLTEGLIDCHGLRGPPMM